MKPVAVALGAVLTTVLGVLIAVQLFSVPHPSGTATTGSPVTASPSDEPLGLPSPVTVTPFADADSPAAPEEPSGDPSTRAADPDPPPASLLPLPAAPDSDAPTDTAVPRQVAAAIATLRAKTHDNNWGPLDVSTFDPAASLSAVTVTAGATGVGQVQVLLFHRATYLGRGTLRPVVSAQVDTDDGGPPDSVGVFYHWDPKVPYSSGEFGSEQFIGFTWNGKRAVMNGSLPDAAFD